MSKHLFHAAKVRKKVVTQKGFRKILSVRGGFQKPNKTRMISLSATLHALGLAACYQRDARMCMNGSRIIMNAAQRIIHAHSCFIHAHSCYAVGKYIYVCDATRARPCRLLPTGRKNIHKWLTNNHECCAKNYSCTFVLGPPFRMISRIFTASAMVML